MEECKREIKRFLGTTTKTFKKGTVKWKWEDDTGKTKKFYVPNTFYIPDTYQRIFSPQNWAKKKDKKPIQVTGERTDAKNTHFFW